MTASMIVVRRLENSRHTFRQLFLAIRRVKCFPQRSRITLNRHSTSSVVDALGCSGPRLHSLLLHSLLSIFVVNAMMTCLVKPRTPLTCLKGYNYYVLKLTIIIINFYVTYLVTSSVEKSYISLCQGISSSKIMLKSL